MKVLFISELFLASSFSNINLHTLYYLRKYSKENDYFIKICREDIDVPAMIKEFMPYKKDAIEVLLPGIVRDWDDERCKNPDVLFTYLGDCGRITTEYWMSLPKHCKKIIYAVWGFNNIPSTWPTLLSGYDEVWTPSSRTCRLMKEIGVKNKIRVLPHGHEPDVFYPAQREPNKKFRFLMTNALALSKGSDLVIRAFMEEFKGDKDVELVLQTTKGNWCVAYVSSTHGQFYNQYLDILNDYNWQNEIYYIEKNAYPWQMGDLYRTADCILQPHRVDCYGLLPLEAAACGVPVITSRYGGPAEYFDENYRLFIEGGYLHTSRQNGVHNWPQGEFGIHHDSNEILTFFNPDKEELKRKMRFIKRDALTLQTCKNSLFDSYKPLEWKDVARKFESNLKEK